MMDRKPGELFSATGRRIDEIYKHKSQKAVRGTLAREKNEDTFREFDIFQGLNLDTKDQEYMLLAVSGLP